MAANEQALFDTADGYVTSLAGHENSFTGENETSILESTRARTRCSSLLRLLIDQVFDLDRKEWIARFGRSWPRAVDFGNAARQRKLTEIDTIMDLVPGSLGFIPYDAERGGFTGHCFIVAGKPELSGESFGALRVWTLEVIDSCRSSHGQGDTRYGGFGRENGGIGWGTMRVVTTDLGSPRGYLWSGRDSSELCLNGDGQEILFCAVPREWKRRAQKTPAKGDTRG